AICRRWAGRSLSRSSRICRQPFRSLSFLARFWKASPKPILGVTVLDKPTIVLCSVPVETRRVVYRPFWRICTQHLDQIRSRLAKRSVAIFRPAPSAPERFYVASDRVVAGQRWLLAELGTLSIAVGGSRRIEDVNLRAFDADLACPEAQWLAMP